MGALFTRYRHQWLLLGYILLLTLGVTWPMFSPLFYEQHEGTAYATRLVSLATGWSEQGRHPRWSPEMAGGHGYPLFNFYAPGFSYLALPFLPFGAMFAIKTVVVLSTLLGLCAAYALGKSLAGRQAGVVLATLCGIAPYSFCNLYARGDFSEYVAFQTAILLLWLLLRMLRSRASPNACLAFGLCYGCFVPIHTISSLIYSVLFGLFALRWAVYRHWNIGSWLRMAGAFSFGLVLSAWYWLPALAEKHLVSTERMLHGHFNVVENFSAFPAYFITPSRSQPLLGPLFTLVLLYLVVVLVLHRRQRILLGLCAVLATVCIALNFPLSRPFWEHAPLARFLQFPWRLTGPAVLFIAVGAASSLRGAWAKRLRPMSIPGAVLIALVMVVALAFALRKTVWLDVSEADFVATPDRWATTSILDEYLPLTANPDLVRVAAPLVTVSSGRVVSTKRNGLSFTAEIDSPTDTQATFRHWDYPGWEVEVDSRATTHEMDAIGRLLVNVPAGKHRIDATLRATKLQAGAEWTSSMAWILALFAAGVVIRKRLITRRDTPHASS